MRSAAKKQSAQSALRHVIEGTASPQEMAELVRGRLRSKRAELALALKTPSP